MKMNTRIIGLSSQHFEEIIEIWEASVRATHHFLPDNFIPTHKSRILNEYFDKVKLHGLIDQNDKIVGFSGIQTDSLEMLFLHPDVFGKGFGKHLLNHAISEGVRRVDVNEKNEHAVIFYMHEGFVMESRSELDRQGNPFPILHLKLKDE